MKKLLCIILMIALAICFAACAPETFDVVINCENVAVGNTVGDASVGIFVNGEQYDISDIYWSVMGEDSMEPIDADTQFESGKYYQMYVYYPIAKGMTSENTTTAYEGSSGELVYIEDVEVDEKGTIEKMALIGFDFMPEVSEFVISCENAAVDNIPADVTIDIEHNGEPIEPVRIYWSVMGEDAMDPIDADTPFEAGKYYQMYVYYPAVEGMDPETTTVSFTGENGEHMYMENEEIDGEPVMMSLIGFDFTQEIPKTLVEITVSNALPGNTVADITTELKIDGVPVEPHRVEWSVVGEDAVEYLDSGAFLLGGECYQQYIYYPVEAGLTEEMITVELSSEYGEHHYVNAADTEDGTAAMMSLIGYDFTAIEDTHKHEWTKDPKQKPIKASCEQEGKEFFVCEICGESKTNKLPKTEHKFDDGKYIGGSCDDGLFYRYECKICKTLKEERKEPSGKHNWKKNPDVEWIEPTCENIGAEYLKCTICGQSKTNLLPKTDHNFVMDRITEGNCATGMHFISKCSGCGAEKESSMTARRHTWMSKGEYWYNSMHIRTCEICGVTKEEDHSLDNRGYCSICDSYIVN